jgi:hypothetical protein
VGGEAEEENIALNAVFNKVIGNVRTMAIEDQKLR